MAEESKAKRRIATLANYKQVFGTEIGKRVLWDMMQEHFILGHTFHDNPHEMSFREGQRNVVLRILNLIKLDTKLLLERLEEEDRREKQNE